MKLSFAFLLLFISFAFVRADVGDQGYDRAYDDLPGMPISLKPTDTAETCQTLCEQNQACVAWAYSHESSACPKDGNFCWLKAKLPPLSQNNCRTSGVKGAGLMSPKYVPFKTGEIMPSGWIVDQLNIQAEGLCGYLADFYSYISNSSWIGGWQNIAWGMERVPYWLNGAVPLAYMSGNAHLMQQVKYYINYIIDHQRSDGWLGPDCCDPWPRFPLLLAMTQYAEADPTDAPRVVASIRKFLYKLRDQINTDSLNSWAQYRWQDLVLTIDWIYDNYPNGEQQWLLDFAEQVHAQGFNWTSFYYSPQFPTVACRGSCLSMATHGVNVGQGLKAAAVWYRHSKDASEIYNTDFCVNKLNQYHGLASGIFSCSEHLAGNMPSQGSETCTVVETMFSYETIFSMFGNLTYAEWFEKLAYNALPAALTPDMWAHVYLQQGNQVNSQYCSPSIYVSDGPESNIFGLEPNFGCCTANFPQGWPKFVSHLYMATQDGGVIVASYAPSVLKTSLNGKPITIELDTEYPFSDLLVFTVTSQTTFPFYAYGPRWSVGPTMQIGSSSPTALTPGQLFKINIPEGTTRITLKFPMNFSLSRRYNGAVSIQRGPLVYALRMQENFKVLKHYAYNSNDWEIEPGSKWAYGLQLDLANPSNSLQFSYAGKVPHMPFSPVSAPTQIVAKARFLPQWGITDNAADAPPRSPVSSASPLEEIVLVPFGATDLRIVEFPILNN